MDQFEQVYADDKIANFSGIKVRRINKTRAFVGEAVLNQPFGNNLSFDIRFYKKQGNEYRLQPYRILRQRLCDFVKSDGKVLCIKFKV